MGGFDVFFSEKDHDTWLPPTNIGFPLNTPDDDRFCFPLDTGSVAYMSVMNNETRQSDICRFVLTQYANPARYTLSGNIELDPELKTALDEIRVSFIEKDINDTLATQNLDKEGKFVQRLPQGNYQLAFTKSDGELIESREINIPPNFPQDNLVVNSRISVAKSSQTATGEMAPTDTFLLENILFAFDKSFISASSAACLNALSDLMKRFPTTRLQITGFTDAIGDEEYNLKLSYRRAMAVADFIKNREVSPSRFEIKGLGETMPVAINSNPDGTDNPEGRKYNRRVELQVTLLPDNWVIIKKDELPLNLKSK
jgi:outer membrane protein OmpA-like peptidoglycan-associated protein